MEGGLLEWLLWSLHDMLVAWSASRLWSICELEKWTLRYHEERPWRAMSPARLKEGTEGKE